MIHFSTRDMSSFRSLILSGARTTTKVPSSPFSIQPTQSVRSSRSSSNACVTHGNSKAAVAAGKVGEHLRFRTSSGPRMVVAPQAEHCADVVRETLQTVDVRFHVAVPVRLETGDRAFQGHECAPEPTPGELVEWWHHAAV